MVVNLLERMPGQNVIHDPLRKTYTILKSWMLVISISTGILVYLLYHGIQSPALHSAGPFLEKFCHTLQPILLFVMLFLNFSKVEPHQMRPHKWQLHGILVQCGFFAVFAVALIWALRSNGAVAQWILSNRILFESAMLCFICPTATAAGVVTDKLGGDIAEVVTYTVLINIAVALIIPSIVPLIHPSGDMSFGLMFSKILAKVFPLLIMPCITAWLVRYLLPKFHTWVVERAGVAFYIWSFSLAMAISVSTRSIVKSDCQLSILLWITLISAISCFLQFFLGKKLGKPFGCSLSAGQSMGQKNTVFSIWLGYTFLDPVTSVVGGIYSICHNTYNSWQLYRHNKATGEK